MKNFDPFYNDLPKTEIHIHLEGSIRTQTIIDVAREYGRRLPAYDVAALDRHVKVYDQMRDLAAVLEAFVQLPDFCLRLFLIPLEVPGIVGIPICQFDLLARSYQILLHTRLLKYE